MNLIIFNDVISGGDKEPIQFKNVLIKIAKYKLKHKLTNENAIVLLLLSSLLSLIAALIINTLDMQANV